MHTIFKSAGTLRPYEDADGEKVNKDLRGRVAAHVKYRLRTSPDQPLVVEIYGYNIMGFGQAIYKLDLDNGVSFTGRTYGSGPLGSPTLQKIHMVDVREPLLGLFPNLANQPHPEVDEIVFGIVSSRPLAHMLCTTRGWSSRGRPFLFIEGPCQRINGEDVSAGLRTSFAFHTENSRSVSVLHPTTGGSL